MADKARCPGCEKVLTPYVPRNGDGSGLFFRHHLDRNGEDCWGWGREAHPSDFILPIRHSRVRASDERAPES